MLQFKAGVSTSDLVLSQSGTSLVIAIAGTTDKVTVQWFTYQNSTANSWNPLQEIQFADGTVWNLAKIQEQLLAQPKHPDAGRNGRKRCRASGGRRGLDDFLRRHEAIRA